MTPSTIGSAGRDWLRRCGLQKRGSPVINLDSWIGGVLTFNPSDSRADAKAITGTLTLEKLDIGCGGEDPDRNENQPIGADRNGLRLYTPASGSLTECRTDESSAGILLDLSVQAKLDR